MSGVDDERKADDYIRRYSGNPWFAFGCAAYRRFARFKGFCKRFLGWWRVHFGLLLRFFTCFALSAFLIFASSFAPVDTKGWSSVRRAYAVVGVDDAMFGLIASGLLIASGVFVTSQAGVDYAGIADDFRSWASENLTNTIWENGSEWVNPTASGSGTGYTIDVSKVPDSVLKGVMDYGNRLSANDGISTYASPVRMSASPIYGTEIVSGTSRPVSSICIANLSSEIQNTLTNYSTSYGSNRFAFVQALFEPTFGSSIHLNVYLGCTSEPVTVTEDSDNLYIRQIDSAAGNYCYARTVYDKWAQNYGSQFSINLLDTVFRQRETVNTNPVLVTVSKSSCKAAWFISLPSCSASVVAGTPEQIQSPVQAYQADPTDENAQVAIDAIRAANPSVTLPETAPQVVNNYNEYVTVNNGSGEVVDPTTPSEFDLTGLADAIAQALGGGATIASVLAALRSVLDGMVTSDALAGEFAGIDSLLRQLVNLEQRAQEWRQQQELNADLDEIIRLLTSIDENVSAILGDMANLDRSTGDLVNLQPVIDAINGLQIPGDPVATDLSNLEHQMLDMTDEDGVTLTVHGLLHWINYYLQDIDRFLHEWNPYEPIDYSTVLGNIYDEVSDFTNTFTQFWADFDNYLDAVLWDLEHLQLAPRTPHAPYPGPLPNPETGIVVWENELNLTALRDAVTRMMQKFPFATINNFVLILTMLVRPAQAPQFDLPLPNPSDWSDPYLVHVDLSIWDVPAAIVRTGTMLWAIARVSRRTVALWTSEEGGGEGA